MDILEAENTNYLECAIINIIITKINFIYK